MARPMPLVEPVTIAVLPVMSKSLIGCLLERSALGVTRSVTRMAFKTL